MVGTRRRVLFFNPMPFPETSDDQTHFNPEEIIGQTKTFDGIFEVYQTDNIFQFAQQMKKDVLKDKGNTVVRLVRIQPKVKINSKGVVVGMLNKKEGLFVCKKYPLSIFKFPLPLTL